MTKYRKQKTWNALHIYCLLSDITTIALLTNSLDTLTIQYFVDLAVPGEHQTTNPTIVYL